MGLSISGLFLDAYTCIEFLLTFCRRGCRWIYHVSRDYLFNTVAWSRTLNPKWTFLLYQSISYHKIQNVREPQEKRSISNFLCVLYIHTVFHPFDPLEMGARADPYGNRRKVKTNSIFSNYTVVHANWREMNSSVLHYIRCAVPTGIFNLPYLTLPFSSDHT